MLSENAQKAMENIYFAWQDRHENAATVGYQGYQQTETCIVCFADVQPKPTGHHLQGVGRVSGRNWIELLSTKNGQG